MKLVTHFGEVTPLHEVTPDAAAKWVASMDMLSEAARKTHIGNAKTIFAEAVRRELISRSPFAAMKGGVTAAQNTRYVAKEEIGKMIDAAPDAEWALLLGLARYAGLRTPSETHLLTWADVDFAAGKLHFRSPKTERFAGKGRRIVPIVPELAAILLRRFDDAPEGETQLVKIRGAGARRRKMLAIAKRAGVELWDDCWQTLRRSAEIDFATDFPAFVAAKWLGHSPTVALRHYTTAVPDEMFHKATRHARRHENPAAQNPAQQASDSARNDTHRPGVETAGSAHNSGQSKDLRTGAEPSKTSNKWSRGESNPRPETVGLPPLRVCWVI